MRERVNRGKKQTLVSLVAANAPFSWLFPIFHPPTSHNQCYVKLKISAAETTFLHAARTAIKPFCTHYGWTG